MTRGLIPLFRVAPALQPAGGRVAAGTLGPMAALSRRVAVGRHGQAYAQDAHSSIRQHPSLPPLPGSTTAPQQLPGQPSPLQG